MNGYNEPFPAARHDENMMAPINSGQRPAFRLTTEASSLPETCFTGPIR
jgi:hypothetical protein